MSDLIDKQKAYEVLTEYYHHQTETQHDALREALSNVPSAEPERKWIPATEALPQNYQQTICIDSRGKMMIGTYGEYGWTFPCYMNEPVAWMPLPEPYRGG